MKKSPLNRKSKKPGKQHEALLDDIWRTVIRLRDGGLCQYNLKQLGRTVPGAHAHHIFSRQGGRRSGFRWDLRNGIYLNGGAHQYAHRNPIDFQWFLQSRWYKNRDEYIKLHALSKMITSRVDKNLVEMALLDDLQTYVDISLYYKLETYSKKAKWLQEIRMSKHEGR